MMEDGSAKASNAIEQSICKWKMDALKTRIIPPLVSSQARKKGMLVIVSTKVPPQIFYLDHAFLTDVRRGRRVEMSASPF
jgi:hypothetical protein